MPTTRTALHFVFQASGTRIHAKAAAPTVAIICAAGPVRVCHSSRSGRGEARRGGAEDAPQQVAIRAGAAKRAAPSRSLPVIGSATTSGAMRQPWR